jgi:ABC-type phosphate/phosphonate transport system permease subunit
MAYDGDPAGYLEALESHRSRQHEQHARVFASIAELYANKGESFGNEEAKQLLGEGKDPKIPSFPVLIFGLAAIKDAVDMLDLTVIGAVVVFFFSVIFAIILGIWTYGKISGGWWKKALIKKILQRYAICITLEMIPFVQLVPTTMVFVLLAHYHETKIAKLFNEALEQLHRGGVPRNKV